MQKSDKIDALTAERDQIQDNGKIDPIDTSNAILVICDAFDIDPLSAITSISDLKDHSPQSLWNLPKGVQLIFDLLETSQSNLDRSISDLRDVIRIELELEKLIETE